MSKTSWAVRRLLTKPNTKAYDLFEWETRDSKLVNPGTGEVVFEQSGLEFPKGWSQNAVNIVAQKYFAGTPGTAGREYSIKQLIDRVVDTVCDHGYQEGYFEDEAEVEVFREELKCLLTSQGAAFNSPVWFNIGAPERAQQASACFILDVEDTMSSVLNWYTEEGIIFKGGSGAGTNLSKIRSSYEGLSKSSGQASGPVSFMRGADASAGTIQSGGKTRRAAKMVILNIDHPDVEDFIWCKAREERKSRALAEAGFDMSLNGSDAHSIQYQNANNSVRVTDDFMKAVEKGDEWDLREVVSGKTAKTVPAKDLFKQIAEASWQCADPGMQFDTTINKWHTTPNAGRINGSNPCSEYMHLDNSACNLASINLLKFLSDDGTFSVSHFKHAVELLITAQEILVGYSDYPTESIGKNARAYRELGLGYANLGALLMAQGLAYDSDEGRAQAASITSIMTGHAYATSAKLAAKVGPFAGYNKDSEGVAKVLNMHREAVSSIDARKVREDLLDAAVEVWDNAVDLNEKHGVRNSQATVIAPTGTIALMMDCDTTGVEPDLGLVKFKSLVGGGSMTIVNQTIPRALETLGYPKDVTKDIVDYIDVEKTIIGAPGFKEEHMPVFACSMGDNPIHYTGHIRMMAAVQPFLSGAISKTVNMPESATVEEVERIHMDSWKLGLKAVAIYRDNCKSAQPLRMAKKEASKEEISPSVGDIQAPHDKFIVPGAVRRELGRVRNSKTFSFKIAGSGGYVTIGEYEDGSPGEVFMRVAKQGSTLSGIMDAFAISVSHGLQYGVPLKSYVKAFINMSFAPSGLTDDKDIKTASSIMDYIFKKLAELYLSFDDRLELGLARFEEQEGSVTDIQTQFSVDIDTTDIEISPVKNEAAQVQDSSAPMCYSCGNQTQRSGSCYVCTSCGTTTGCS